MRAEVKQMQSLVFKTSAYKWGGIIEVFFFRPPQLSKRCSVLSKSHLGAKRDFEIWAFKVFSLDTKSSRAPLRLAF